MDELVDAERYHKEAIAEIQRRARLEAQPHIDALARIESLRPPRPMIVMPDENGHIVPAALRSLSDKEG